MFRFLTFGEESRHELFFSDAHSFIPLCLIFNSISGIEIFSNQIADLLIQLFRRNAELSADFWFSDEFLPLSKSLADCTNCVLTFLDRFMHLFFTQEVAI